MVRQEPAKLLSPSSNLGVAFFNAKNKVNKVFAKLFKRKIDNFIYTIKVKQSKWLVA